MKKSFSERVFSVFSDLRREEIPTAVAMISALFFLLACYYVMKTLREPMILSSKAEDQAIIASGVLPHWLSDFLSLKGTYKRVAAAAGQSIVLCAFIPFFNFLASRLKRSRLIVAVTLFFLACLGYFAFAMSHAVPFTGFGFYIWVGIFSVATVSLFWSYAADIYTPDDGKRIFPFIGIGASLGAPIGTLIANFTFENQWSNQAIIGTSVGLLSAFLALILLINHRIGAGQNAVTEKAEKADEKSTRGGFALVFRSPYLRTMAVMILMLNLVNTTGEYILSEYIVAHANEVAAGNPDNVGAIIGSSYADFYFWVNIISLIIQAFIVSRMVKFGGMKVMLFALPVISLGVYAFAFFGVGFMAMRWLKTTENATNYSVMNTVKAMLFLPVSEAEKYKAKQTIDTFFVRIGDFISAFVIILTGNILALSVQNIALMNVCFVILWLGVCWQLYRHYKEQASEL